MEMRNIADFLRSTVSISSFNKGQAGKIFDDVKKHGSKIVIKNNVPECILISPEDYLSLMEKVENMELAQMANQRKLEDNGIRYSNQQVMDELGLSEEDLLGFEDIEIE